MAHSMNTPMMPADAHVPPAAAEAMPRLLLIPGRRLPITFSTVAAALAAKRAMEAAAHA
jgi:hypothetical protein